MPQFSADMQHTRQQPQDSYVLADVLATLRAAGVPVLTDDNYAVMKVARIGCEWEVAQDGGQRDHQRGLHKGAGRAGMSVHRRFLLKSRYRSTSERVRAV